MDEIAAITLLVIAFSSLVLYFTVLLYFGVISPTIELANRLTRRTAAERNESRMSAEEIAAKMQFQNIEIGGPLKCLVCGGEIVKSIFKAGFKDKVFLCTSCQAPFHEDCWAYAKHCCRYGCKSKSAKPYSVDVIA